MLRHPMSMMAYGDVIRLSIDGSSRKEVVRLAGCHHFTKVDRFYSFLRSRRCMTRVRAHDA